MAIVEADVLAALRTIPFPGFARDIVSLGVIARIRVEGDRIDVDLRLAAPAHEIADRVERAIRDRLSSVSGVGEVRIRRGGAVAADPALPTVGAPPPRPSVAAQGAVDPRVLPGVRSVVAVASGKGGVGKSTVAVNLAVALARRGLSVGLLDADIHGPSVPMLVGLHGASPRVAPGSRRLAPFERYGMRLMSLGFLVDPDSAVIWRGPMVMKALDELLTNVEWGDLDVLVVDLPPGTGDAQLTLSQRVRLTGAVIVTTPQDVATADAIKGVAMFRKVGVPILGIVENMSQFACPHCGERTDVFGHGGGRREAERLGVPFLGEIPLEPAVRVSGDDGQPVALTEPPGPSARAFADLAASVAERLRTESEDRPPPGLFARFKRLWDPDGRGH
jgi:ATP-binding protein involved in chromosome partitioning